MSLTVELLEKAGSTKPINDLYKQYAKIDVIRRYKKVNWSAQNTIPFAMWLKTNSWINSSAQLVCTWKKKNSTDASARFQFMRTVKRPFFLPIQRQWSDLGTIIVNLEHRRQPSPDLSFMPMLYFNLIGLLISLWFSRSKITWPQASKVWWEERLETVSLWRASYYHRQVI